ncbi:MAG: IS630 family transposase [Candidatus Krumholzibacteria bacterium]|nr:IS630 family transposase [Candidatus Krumholzibacteria bacterium]
MPRGPHAVSITLSDEARAELEAMMRSRSLPNTLVRRARLVLLAAEGRPNGEIAELVGLSRAMVVVWRQRFAKQGIMGLYDGQRPGGPRSIEDERISALLRKTLKSKPKDGTHWSCRSIAQETGLSKSTVQRVWQAFGIQPHRRKHFKLSTDPFFVEKVRDIVGLYLNPPDNAMVLCVDEKSQIQALDRTQPLLPMGLGYVEGVTHDYVRHGTTTLFAALDIASGRVLARCTPRHRHQEFLRFLNEIDANVPKKLDVHLVIDNYSTHKHQKVRRWLAARPRFHVHYTPTYGSWLNQVEIWFNIITQRAIRRGTFQSVKDLIRKIEIFVAQYNRKSKPFIWTATADSILQKIERLCQTIAGTRH